MANDKMPCCPVCTGPRRSPKIEASGACCCFHTLTPNFVPSEEQLAEAEARLAQSRERGESDGH